MIKQVLMNFNHPWLPTLGVLIFITLFVSMLVWINRRGSDPYYAKAENLPLEEGVRSER
ncbi:cbb3-type cytochrome c oxidase subunit 3 [Halobacteriovorax sp. HLS]|uniref:cbb3-type cytochrome c oxidase subunit 3 n=1 Tax=Halobacteriovorax sp. HLS TaxID=2234000 RepID=UPI000FD9A21D|nr:cbb3-type cytochrome c oxidase subunit 3 [Halobacteriovorax sp. HLS]